MSNMMTSPPPVPDGQKAKITLTGTAATLLLTLAARMQDCESPHPILNDQWSIYVAAQTDYDYSTIGVPATTKDTLCLRVAQFDRWTRDFLSAHVDEPVTVLHIACGLDARAHRVKWGPNVRWIDLDLPDVVELRRKLIPAPEGDYTLVAGSVLDEDVLRSVPNDRPTVVVIEGLMFYLDEMEARDLLRRVCARLQTYGGQLLFDVMSPALVRMHKFRRSLAWYFSAGSWMEKQGAVFQSGMAYPAELEELQAGLKLLDTVPWTEIEGITDPTVGHRVMQVLSWLPIPPVNGYCPRFAF